MNIKRLYSAGAIIIICTIIVTIQAASAAPTISVEPSYLSVFQGDNFTVNITIDPCGDEVMGAEYKLYFNDSLLNVLSQNKGSFLSQDDASTVSIVNNVDGMPIEYGEMRTGVTNGVTTSGTLAAIKFEVIGVPGVSELRIADVMLSDPIGPNEIPDVAVCDGHVGVVQPSTPFLINGYVSYKNGSECDDPAINITNMNICKEWTTETNESSNYYQLTLVSCADVIADEVLQFNATSPDGILWNATEHEVTLDEVYNGGIFDLNITLESTTPAPHLVTYAISNTTISPNGDWIMDDTDIDIRFSEHVAWEITIENNTSVIYDWTGTSTNPTPKTWDGTYAENDTIVPDGIYHVNITGTHTSTGLSIINNTECIVVDTTSPTVTDNSPTGTGVPVSTNITATFDEAMNPDTLDNATVTIEHNGTAVAGNITYDAPSKTVTFDPAGDLNYSETYNATITTGVQDIAGNNMSSNITWNFTTSSTDAIISIGNVSGNTTVPIVIENAANVGSAHINITYNASVCMITDVANGTFDLTFANLEHNETGWVRIGAIHTEKSGLCGSIILANVTFRSNGTNGTSPLNLSVITLKDATPDCNEIPYSVQNGTYTAVLNGDVNGDGVVDIADAMYLAKHVLGKSGFEEIIEEVADVNDDGIIDIADAMYLAKYVLGKSGFEELR